MESDSVFTRKEIEASFPGGISMWIRYITAQIEQNEDKLEKEKRYGTCFLKFIVDTEGNVSDVEAITMQGSTLSKIAVSSIIKGPKWIPAMRYEKYVKAYRLQPVSLVKPD